MIKCDFGKQTAITGHAIQIAAELECLAREVRIALCNTLGEECGMELYNETIKMAALSEAESDRFCKEEFQIAKSERPEVARKAEEHTDMLMRMMFGDTSSSVSVKEE